jgi:hypothetical protein
METTNYQHADALAQTPLVPFGIMEDNATSAWMLEDFWFMDGLPPTNFN